MSTSSNYSADTFVTAANPAPGRQIVFEYPVRSGTHFGVAYTTRSDGGIGQNVYIAGGVGPGGVIPVSQTNPTSISLSGVSIGGVLEVTTSAGNPVNVTGSVYVINQTSGSSFPTGTLTASITGVVTVSQTNVPATQSVYVVNQTSGNVTVSNFPATQSVSLVSPFPLQVSGNVGVVGIASVRIESTSAPLNVTGVVSVEGTASITGVVTINNQVTGVFVLGTASFSQTNIPTTQSVYVVNQTSGTISISGVLPVSGTIPVTGTVVVSNLPVTQTVYVANQTTSSFPTGSIGVTSTLANPVWVTGTVSIVGFSGSISGSGGGGMPPASGSSHHGIAFSTSTTVLLAANASRKALSIYNDSDQTYLVRLGTGASTSSWSFSLFSQQFYESPYPGFTGDVSGIGFTSGSGVIHVEEMT